MKNKTFPILLAFLCMGFGDAVGPFVGLAKEHFQLTNLTAQLIAFMGFIMFGILSVPMGVLQDRKGKKFILLLGLVIALIGVAIPFFGLTKFPLFLATVLLLGAGASILQVAGNPIMREVSPPEKYSRNLSIGQFVKAIGSLSGSLIPFAAAKWWGMDFSVLFPIYTVAMLFTVVWIFSTRIEEHKDPAAKPASLASCLALLSNAYVLTMVLGIFIYVGTEVCISTGVPIYLNTKFDFKLETWGVLGNSFFFIWILTGRFLGSVVLNWISAPKFLLLTIFVTIVGLAGMILIDNWTIAVVCIALAGIGCANVFPLIFSITINKMPERSNEISGLMVTAIVGGAFVPLLMGFVADNSTVTMGFVVPLACCLYLLYTAMISLKTHTAVN
jgi:MFS transporter, FHS family, L-fucose permease